MLKTPEELRLELGRAIRARRIGQGWSQEEAAKRAGMGLSTWKRMETHGPSLVENLINAALALRCEHGLSQLFPVSSAEAIETPSDTPSSYDIFLRATRPITRWADDVAAAFRRMVFNILACNRDDHMRQHLYLMNHSGEWRLVPAFDLTYAPGPGEEHCLDIEGEDRRPTRAQVTSLGKSHGLDAKRMTAMIEETTATVVDWPMHARAPGGASKGSMKVVQEALTRVLADFVRLS